MGLLQAEVLIQKHFGRMIVQVSLTLRPRLRIQPLPLVFG
jgi:hypothetical protein